MKGFWYDVSTRAVAGLVVSILGVIATTAFAVWGSSKLQFVTAYPILAPTVFGVVTFVLAVVGVSKWYALKPRLSRVTSDFQVLEKEISMVVNTKQDIVYTKKVKLRAKRKGLSRYLDRYHWTGGRVLSITCTNKTFTFRETHPKNQWKHYEVVFPRVLNRNDIVDVELRWKLTDEGSMIPFISTRIDEPTEKLTFKLTIDQSFGVDELVREIATHSGSLNPDWTESVKYDGGVSEWKIESPKLAHHYEIRWTPSIPICPSQK